MDRRERGAAGEVRAAAVLEAAGLRIVARNVRTRRGEVDLVCREPGGWVFAEVKTRAAGSFVAAAEAVDRRKLTRLAALAEAYLAARGAAADPWRLLVVAVTVEEAGARVELVAVDEIRE